MQKRKNMKNVSMRRIYFIICGVIVLCSLMSGCDFTNSQTQLTLPTLEPEQYYSQQTTQPNELEETYRATADTLQNEQTIQELPENSTFEIHFIDVGQADSALVICDGHYMLVDGGNSADSNVIFTYLRNLGANHIDYMIGTHAHEDHMGGLAGALNYATVDTFFCSTTDRDTKFFQNVKMYLEKQKKGITVPTPGYTFTLGSASVMILGPLNENDNENNNSIVLRIQYGKTSFLLTGDAEREEEQEILDAGYNVQATVLKVGHHGSNSSTSYPFLREIMPQYAIISVGKGNDYGHPSDGTLSRLRDADVTVYRTDLQGDVICTSDGENVTITTGKAVEPTVVQSREDTEQSYILNTRSMKFHLPTCSSVGSISEANRQDYHGTRTMLLEMGYDPCGRCKP